MNWVSRLSASRSIARASSGSDTLFSSVIAASLTSDSSTSFSLRCSSLLPGIRGDTNTSSWQNRCSTAESASDAAEGAVGHPAQGPGQRGAQGQRGPGLQLLLLDGGRPPVRTALFGSPRLLVRLGLLVRFVLDFGELLLDEALDEPGLHSAGAQELVDPLHPVAPLAVVDAAGNEHRLGAQPLLHGHQGWSGGLEGCGGGGLWGGQQRLYGAFFPR